MPRPAVAGRSPRASALSSSPESEDTSLERLRRHGAQLVGEVVQYKDAYRLCYIRAPEGILIGLAQELG